jgi:hypothetical protein
MKTISIVLVTISITSCTAADVAQLQAFGSPAEITCYSGGVKFYQGRSTGKIATEKNSDGWYFREMGTGNLIRVGGTCLIRN